MTFRTDEQDEITRRGLAEARADVADLQKALLLLQQVRDR